jgi:hypothetical protein
LVEHERSVFLFPLPDVILYQTILLQPLHPPFYFRPNTEETLAASLLPPSSRHSLHPCLVLHLFLTTEATSHLSVTTLATALQTAPRRDKTTGRCASSSYSSWYKESSRESSNRR